jgi:hypothetical protein
MVITRQTVAERISSYHRREQRLAEIVAWAEEAMREGESDDQDFTSVRDVVARLGLADIAAFGLTWEEAVEMLSRLGYRATVDIQAVRT